MTTSSNRILMIALAVGLVVSLCVNAFAGGALLAARWLDYRAGASAEKVLEIYPAEIRRDVLRRLIADRAELMAAVKDLRDARQRMFAVMRSGTLDQRQLTVTMADVRDKTATLQAVLQSALAASLADMPASERQKITPPSFGFDIFGEGKAESP